MAKVWTKQEIVALLETNDKADKAVERALIRLNERQVDDEQIIEETKYRNGQGFRPCHAHMGTSMAKQILRRGNLSPKQIAYWRVRDKKGNMRIGIYANQLLLVMKTDG